MAKQLIKPGREESLQPLSPLRPAPPRTARKWVIALVVTGLAVAICTLAAHLALPKELWFVWQRLTGLACAVLAVLAFALATRPTESPEEEMLERIRRGQHADFGKRLRQAQEVRTTVKLPILGDTSIRGLVGIGIFLAVAGWWLSPAAPIRMKEQVIADMTVPLAEEIAAVVLVMPDGNIAVPQPPIPPLQTRKLAELIDDSKANSYQRGLKAMALSHFKEARGLLAEAMSNDDAPPYDIRVARAQVEMYAGRFEEAAQWYNDALQDHPDDPLLLCQLAVARIQLGQFAAAEPLVSRAVKACGEELPTERNPALAACLHVRAVLSVGLGKPYDEAVVTCLQAREIFKETLARQHPFEAASLNNQATLYLLQAKYQGGQELYRRAGEHWSRTLGRSHPYVAASLGNLAMLYYKLGRYTRDEAKEGTDEAAEELLEHAFAIRDANLPEPHPILAINRNASAVVQTALARYAEAQARAEDALGYTVKAMGPEHANVAPCLDTLATVYAGQALYTTAELHYLRAVTVAKNVWGPNHPYVAGILNHLAELYIERGRYQDAEVLCDEALEILKAALGEKHPSVATVLNTRGRLQIQRGQPRNGRPDLEEALEVREKALGKEHPDFAHTLANLAALDATSPLTNGAAVARYKRAIELLDARLGLEHPDVARLLCRLAALYVPQSKYPEAEACLERALRIQEHSLVPFHPDLAATLDAYAALLRKMNPPDPEKAAKMASRAKSIRAAHAEEDRQEPSKTPE